jgi:hypothetical protein
MIASAGTTPVCVLNGVVVESPDELERTREALRESAHQIGLLVPNLPGAVHRRSLDPAAVQESPS